eukprot:CFRG0679T1
MFVSSVSQTDFSGCTLVIPAVSLGNVPQLAIDLIINTLRPQRVGHIHDRSLLPVFGCDAFDAHGNKSMTSADVYLCATNKLAIIQQRSPVIKSQRKEFTDRLGEWIISAGFSSVILLTSSNANNSGDNTMLANSASLRYVINSHATVKADKFTELGWKQWVPMSSSAPYLHPGETSRIEKQRVAGGGLTKSVYNMSERANIPLSTLILFCSEGDNVPDGVFLATELNKLLNLKAAKSTCDPPPTNTEDRTLQWRAPVSWRALYGPRQQRSIF